MEVNSFSDLVSVSSGLDSASHPPSVSLWCFFFFCVAVHVAYGPYPCEAVDRLIWEVALVFVLLLLVRFFWNGCIIFATPQLFEISLSLSCTFGVFGAGASHGLALASDSHRVSSWLIPAPSVLGVLCPLHFSLQLVLLTL